MEVKLLPSTGSERIQQLTYNTNYTYDATDLLKLLNKYLLMVTFENSESYSLAILYDSKYQITAQYLI